MIKDEATVFIVGVILLSCLILIWGLVWGANIGAENACQSVKMEWVKDKCMKVTREEVK
jgi:hypothetical protein